MGNVSTYLSQSVYFIGQYKEKTQVKINFSNSLIQEKGMRFGGLIFLKLMKFNCNTSVLESSSMQDTLSKVLINLASRSLLTVPVIYLVLHQGTGMQTQQILSFKEM
jgi:hypothetical protein